MLTRIAVLLGSVTFLVALSVLNGCNGSGTSAPGTSSDPAATSGGGSATSPAPTSPAPGSSTPAPSAAASATWFVSEGVPLIAAQVAALFDANLLYFNVQSTINSSGELRGALLPFQTSFLTDAGDPFAPNPGKNPVTFAALLGGDQVRPRNVATFARGYGSITLAPLTGQITGFVVASGISGSAAYLRDGLPGETGAIVCALEGGPVIWTVPAGTVASEAQLARLAAGGHYLEVQSGAFPDGEIRGQLNQQVRFASLSGSSEVPAVTTSALGFGMLALNPATLIFSGSVEVTGINSTILVISLQIGAAGTNGVGGLVSLTNSGNGIWSLPPNTVLSAAQVASFNNDELYYNVHTQDHVTGELRGQLLKSGIRIASSTLTGSQEVPPVASQGTGTGMLAINPITGQVVASVRTAGVDGTSVQIGTASASATDAPLVTLSTASPVTVVPAPGISFALDIQPIFNANCIASVCHATGGRAPMSLQPGLGYAGIIDRVVPGNATASFLIARLSGASPPRMPLGGTPLSATSFDLIRSWIDKGALNN